MEPAPHESASDRSIEIPNGPLAVAEHCWMVGYRNPASLLQCNTYVRTFDDHGGPLHLCIDPGSQLDYPVIEQNLKQLIGDVGQVSAFTVNHQDPDVVGNAPLLCQANPNVGMIVTEETWRLVRHLRFQPKRVHFANDARSQVMMLGDQHTWRLVPTPFCHFRGAMAFYDVENRMLFSGDLFGGLNPLSRVHLWATDADWAGIAQFHQIYMPMREALRYAVRQIRALRPAVEIIAPQHGCAIRGELVETFLERLYDLLVGFDLWAADMEDTFLPAYREVVAKLLAHAAGVMGSDEVLSRLKSEVPLDGLRQLARVEGSNVLLDRSGFAAVAKIVARLITGEPNDVANALRESVLAACTEHGVPIPPIGVAAENMLPMGTGGPEGIQTQAWWLS